MPFPNKISCFVSTCVSSDNLFPSVRQEPSFGPWKGSLFLQQVDFLLDTGATFCSLEVIRLRTSVQVEALQLDSCIRDQDRRKSTQKEGLKRRKGKKVNKVSCFLPSQGTNQFLCQEENRDKRVPVSTTGSGWSADELVPEYPSGQLY